MMNLDENMYNYKYYNFKQEQCRMCSGVNCSGHGSGGGMLNINQEEELIKTINENAGSNISLYNWLCFFYNLFKSPFITNILLLIVAIMVYCAT